MSTGDYIRSYINCDIVTYLKKYIKNNNELENICNRIKRGKSLKRNDDLILFVGIITDVFLCCQYVSY